MDFPYLELENQQIGESEKAAPPFSAPAVLMLHTSHHIMPMLKFQDRHQSGRNTGINRTDLSTLWRIVVTFTLYADFGVDDIYVPLILTGSYCTDRTFRFTDTTGYAVFNNL